MSDEAGPVVRPYMLTGGRTASVAAELPIETLVVAQPDALSASFDEPLTHHQREVVALLTGPLSIAEVAAHLLVPVGVARVLVSIWLGSTP